MGRRKTARETELTGEEGRSRVRADTHGSQPREMEREKDTRRGRAGEIQTRQKLEEEWNIRE